MVDKECNLRTGVYKVQTFGTTQIEIDGGSQISSLARISKSQAVILLLTMYLISSGPILAFF